VDKKFGGLDILISNAAVLTSAGSILDVSYAHLFSNFHIKSLLVLFTEFF